MIAGPKPWVLIPIGEIHLAGDRFKIQLDTFEIVVEKKMAIENLSVEFSVSIQSRLSQGLAKELLTKNSDRFRTVLNYFE